MKKNIIIMIAFLAIGSAVKGQTLSLTLEEALRIANENNRSLKTQRLEQDLSREKIKESSGKFRPSISANTGYSYFFDRQVVFMPGSFVGENQQPVVDIAVGGRNAFGASMGLHQPIISTTLKNQLNSSRISHTIQETVTADIESDLKIEVSSIYNKLLYNDAVIKVYNQSLEYNNKALNDSKMLLKQGKSLVIDTLQNYIRVENVKTHLSYLHSQHHVLMLQLSNSLGLDDDFDIILLDSLTLSNIPVYQFTEDEDNFFRALESRTDIRLHQLYVELNKSNVMEAQSRRLPTLAAVAEYSVQMQADDLINDSYSWPKTSFVGLQLNMPVFLGNRVNSQVKQSKILLEQSQIQLENSKENAKTEVALILSKLNDAIKRLNLNEKIVQSASKSYEIVSNRYSLGLSSRLELTDAELSLNQAKLNSLQAVFDIKTTNLELDRAIGNLTIN